jgi:ATP-dependent RNA helicase DeaD
VFRTIIEQYEREHDVPAIEIATALARLAHGDTPLLLPTAPKHERREADTGTRPERKEFAPRTRDRDDATARPRPARTRDANEAPAYPHAREARPPRDDSRGEAAHRDPEPGMETFRVEVGHMHGVKPGNIVGAIANEAELDSKHIGRITIREGYSLIDLPEGMPSEILTLLKKVWVAGQLLRISRGTSNPDRDDAGSETSGAAPARRSFAPKSHAGTRPPRPAGAGTRPDKPRRTS